MSQDEIQKAGESDFRETIGHEGYSTCIEYLKNLPVLALLFLYPETIISLLLVGGYLFSFMRGISEE